MEKWGHLFDPPGYPFFKLSALVASLLGVAGENPTVVLVRNVGFLALAAASGELSRHFFFFFFNLCLQP